MQKPLHISLLILFILSIFSCQHKTEVKKLSNLLIIQTDEHNFRTLGCYRNTLSADQAFVWGEGIQVKTPHIDGLAANGALCTSFYAATPVCSPSRASFMSGRYPHHTPVVTNDIPLNDNIKTFAEQLVKQGYESGYSGKWHLDGTGKPQWAPERKFGFQDNRFMFNRGHWKMLEETDQGPRVASRDKDDQPDYGIKGSNSFNFTTDFLTQKTIEFITKERDKPFCYMVSLPDPHGPNTVRAPYDTMYTHFDFQKPKTAFKDTTGLPTWAKMSKKTINSHQMAQYFGMVKCIDDNVGKIVDALKKTNQLSNTIIVFTSDHGDLCGEHGKDNKGNPLEASAKIPFILQYTGVVREGLIIDQALSTVDFLPTIINLMGFSTVGLDQGRDASCLFNEKEAKDTWEDLICIRGTGKRNNLPDINWLAAVTDQYKLVYSPASEPWLIDLTADPDEITNQFKDSKYQPVITELTNSMLEYGKKFEDPRIHHEKMRGEMEMAINP